MSQVAYALFPTRIGSCAVLWRGGALTGVLLPATDENAAITAINARARDAVAAQPPASIGCVIDRITQLCAGKPVGFDDACMDRSRIEPFANQVYDILMRVPFGEMTTYGAIAAEIGDRNLSRAVGAALGANPFPIVIPCHRVVGADGRLGGFSAPGGGDTKRRLLDIEGAFAADKLPLFGG
jgi:methylated-DNA-[protein]-cysteine S-methyltransferase